MTSWTLSIVRPYRAIAWRSNLDVGEVPLSDPLGGDAARAWHLREDALDLLAERLDDVEIGPVDHRPPRRGCHTSRRASQPCTCK